MVWQGRHPTARDVAVKMFRAGYEKDPEKELENVGKVASLAGVSKLVGVKGQPHSASLSSGPRRGVLPTVEHFAQLVDIVEAHDFYGALYFAADAVLTAYDTKVVGLPRHDLEMIVKVTSPVCPFSHEQTVGDVCSGASCVL